MAKNKDVVSLSKLSPQDAAEAVVGGASPEWAREFGEALERRIGRADLDLVMSAWDLSAADVARAFGVTRQAVAKWRSTIVPADRVLAVADLAAATEHLSRFVKSERIPAVVRRPSDLLGGLSLLDLALAGDTQGVRNAVVATLDVRRLSS